MANDLEEMFAEIAPDVSGLSVDQMIREYIRLDNRIKEAAGEREAYKKALIDNARATQNGQKTVHLETADESKRIGVEFKKGVLCDQVEIECAKELLSEEKFREIFKVEYSPKARNLKSFLNTKSGDEKVETAKSIIKEAIKEVDKAPYVTVEKA